MKALKFLKRMKQTDTPYNFRECEINEAIEELEEAMNLTRREWYQKGFNEAMKTKTCDGCKFRNNVKFVQVVDETLECCYVCVRQCYDYFEPKDNA